MEKDKHTPTKLKYKNVSASTIITKKRKRQGERVFQAKRYKISDTKHVSPTIYKQRIYIHLNDTARGKSVTLNLQDFNELKNLLPAVGKKIDKIAKKYDVIVEEDEPDTETSTEDSDETDIN